MIRALVLAFELINRQQIGHEPVAPVRRIGGGRLRVAVDRERVRNAPNDDVQIERVVVGVIDIDPEIAEAAIDRRLKRSVVGHVGIRHALDVADQPVVNFGRLGVRVAVSGPHADRGLVLARVIHDLPHEGRQAVDRQTRAPFRLAILAHLLGPLLAQARETQIVNRPLPIHRFGIVRELEPLLRIRQCVAIGHYPSQLPEVSDAGLRLPMTFTDNANALNASAACEFSSCSGTRLNCLDSGSTSYR